MIDFFCLLLYIVSSNAIFTSNTRPNSHGTNKSIYPNGVVREKSSIYPLNELVNFMLFHETKFIPSIWMIEKGDGHTEKQIQKKKKYE